MRSRQRNGFTLIELLVVIAIIAILAAILFPILLSAKKRAGMSSCVDNLKQLSMGIRMYADSYNGRLPCARIVLMYTGRWDWVGSPGVGLQVVPQKGQIWGFVKSAKSYVCPNDLGRAALLVKDNNVPIKNYANSYTMNTMLCALPLTSRDQGLPLLMDSVLRPTKCLMLIHESRDTIDDGDFWWTGWNKQDKIHYDGTTVAYIDGHAVWKSNRQLTADMGRGDWTPL